MAELNLANFIRNDSDGENITVEGFSLKFEASELPEILKGALPYMKMLKEGAAEHNGKELEKVVKELNNANEKLREAERENRSITAKLEAKERSVERLIEREKELKSEVEDRNAEICKLRQELFKAQLPHEKLDDQDKENDNNNIKLWD